MGQTTRQIRSTLTEAGTVQLSLVTETLEEPGPDEVVVRVEAAPINPSDLALMLALGDPATARAVTGQGDARIELDVPPAARARQAARVGQRTPVGNEGAGTVIAAGDSDAARALLGKTVAIYGGGMYAEYRKLNVTVCLPLPEGTPAAAGAACFVNPLTALGMLETMRADGHSALVHTAAASNLGQMLVKLCRAEGVPLVNVVRRPAQVALLREIGATHVVDSSQPGFRADLERALAETDATLAFDATGGGDLADTLLTAMEAVQLPKYPYSVYGTPRFKQIYLYGMLDRSPTVLRREYGFAWGVSAWLLPHLLARVGAERAMAMRARVVAELQTIFASHYGTRIALDALLDLEQLRSYGQITTGNKFLVTPHGAA